MTQLNSVVLTGLAAITARGDFTLQSANLPQTDAGNFTLQNFALENYLSSAKTYLDRASALALAGGALALRDAGIEWPVTHERFGITLGTHHGCVDTMHKFMDVVTEKGARLANPLLFSHSYFNSPISLCAIEFGLKGYHATFSAHESSGLAAVHAACDAITLGHADAMLCGGIEAVTPARAACEEGALGEAAVFFLLESRQHAEARGKTQSTAFDSSRFPSAAAIASLEQNYGRCGGSAGVLALALELTSEA